jgi:hypothetical protein
MALVAALALLNSTGELTFTVGLSTGWLLS